MPKPELKLQEETIGDRVKIVRTCLKLTQAEFAKKVGFFPSRISEVETGVREAPIKMISEIGKLGFDLNWLVNGKVNEEIFYQDIGDDTVLLNLFTKIKKQDNQVVKAISTIVDLFPEK